jgi:hypothetical protein
MIGISLTTGLYDQPCGATTDAGGEGVRDAFNAVGTVPTGRASRNSDLDR